MTRNIAITILMAWCAVQGTMAQSVPDEKSSEELDVQLREVVVTGTGTKHYLKNAPVQTEVLTREALEQYQARTIEELLEGLVPSISFSESDMGSGLQMSGLGNSYVLILIDGKRMHGDVGGENDLGLIDPQNIERIEIVKGASSALYGSDAIAGVINIITRKHKERGWMVENITRAGSYADVRQHNTLALNFGRWSSQTNFQLQHTDGWQNTSTEDPHQTEYLITDSRNKTVNRYTNWQVSERLTWQPTDALEFYASGSIYRKRIYRPCGTHSGVDTKTYDLRYNNASAALGGEWKVNNTDVVTLDVDWNRHAYYYDFTDTTLTDGVYNGQATSYFPYFPGQSQLQSDQRRTMAHLKGVFELPRDNRLSVGAEWRYDWLKAPNRIDGGKAHDNTAALYAQDEYTPLKWLNVTAGLRLNRNQQFGWRLTPKVSALAMLGEDWRVRVTWSEGFKTPTLKELYYQYVRNMSGTYLYLGNTDLKPQTSDYLALGIEYNRGRWKVSLTAYYNWVHNMIALTTIANHEVPEDLYTKYQPLKTRQYHNMESAKTRGVDLSVSYRIHRDWTAGVSYSYLDTDAKEYDEDSETLQDVIIDGMAHHKASWHVAWRHQTKRQTQWGAGLYGRASSKRYYQEDGNGKAYHLWRVTGSYGFSARKNKRQPLGMRLEVGVDNIFNYVDRTYHGLHLGTTTPGTTVFAAFSIQLKQGKTNVKSQKINNQSYEEN